MVRKFSIWIFIVMLLLITGCVKESYDMNLLSEEIHYSPSMALLAVNGKVTLDDIVEQGDTVVFDEDNMVKIVFEEDSLFSIESDEFYDLDDMVSFSQSYALGELSIDPFDESISLSLDEISTFFPSALRAQFVALDNTTNNFPAFTSTDLGEHDFPSIINFENALFSSGAIDITITNNLPAPIDGINIQLYNSSDHSPVGNPVVFPALQPGESELVTVNLSGESVTSSIVGAIVLTGSPGTTEPVDIDLTNQNIQIDISGRDLFVESGRVILPVQAVGSLDEKDTIDFDPGDNIEIDELKILTGDLTYDIQTVGYVDAVMDITLPSVTRSGVAVTEEITLDAGTPVEGAIDLDNTIFDLGTDVLQPYNRIPMEYTIEVTSAGSMIDFSSEDEFVFNIELTDLDFDYVKGFFGQETESIDPDTIDLEIEDILDKVSGEFLISSPSIALNYSNSFAIPIEVSMEATGSRDAETISLGLSPFIVNYPDAPEERDISDIFAIDKDNSSLPELISMPPATVSFSGSIKMNPEGNDGTRDNYLFGDSRFLGSLEIEVPLEFRFNNLHFADTVENFLKSDDDDDDDSPVMPDDFQEISVVVSVENGFPLGVSLSMSLYDSLSGDILSTIEAKDLLEPAPVNADGKVTEPSETTTSIEFTNDFFNSIDDADEIIFSFTLNSTGEGLQDVKIYSDYGIEFNAMLVVQADINFK